MKLSRIFSSLFLIATSIFICIFTPHKAFAIGQWTSTGSMLDTILNQYFDPVPASGDPIVMLQNGKVFSNGSASLFGNVISLQQTYDPSTGQWTATSRENSIRQYVVPIVLNNGKVLVAGGANDNGSNVLRSCPNNSQWGGSPASELYDPSTNQWSYTPGLPVGVAFYTATKLLDGRVLIVGGVTCESDPQTITTATQIYDPSTGHWTRSGDAPKQVANGSGNNLAVLNDGRVLMIGSGNYDNQFTPSAESDLFDPSTGQWTRTGDLHVARFSGNLVKLQDGRVLLMSGNSGNAYTT